MLTAMALTATPCYDEGQNIAIEYRWGKSLDTLPAVAAELVSLKVDVIVTTNTP